MPFFIILSHESMFTTCHIKTVPLGSALFLEIISNHEKIFSVKYVYLRALVELSPATSDLLYKLVQWVLESRTRQGYRYILCIYRIQGVSLKIHQQVLILMLARAGSNHGLNINTDFVPVCVDLTPWNALEFDMIPVSPSQCTTSVPVTLSSEIARYFPTSNPDDISCYNIKKVRHHIHLYFVPTSHEF